MVYRIDYIWLVNAILNGTLICFDHLVPECGCSSLSLRSSVSGVYNVHRFLHPRERHRSQKTTGIDRCTL